MRKVAEIMYDPLTGKFWREAGTLGATGYRQIWFQGQQHMEHRVAWFLHYGEWPKDQIDHINGVRDDNRICNLREATYSENQCNRKIPKNNKSGFKGVSWNPARKAWQVTIRYGGTNKNLGYFSTRERAAEMYDKAALKHHGKFARLDL
jgi:hypothetical protein